VGGYAVGYYGYPRATADLDIWIQRDEQNATNIIRVLEEFGFQSTELSIELFLKEKQIVRMGIPPLRIELHTTISGVDFDECYSNRIIAILDTVEVSLISLQHLKQNKSASGRLKDLNDLEHLP
jgi:hypothetical protein